MTAGGTYGAGVAPAGWYADPQNPAAQRYWDGGQWTEHVAAGAAVPAPSPRKTGSGLIIGIIAGVGVLVVIGILAAIAIPVFLAQREKAQDTAAKADVALLGMWVATWYVDHEGGPPAVTVSGGEYSVDHVAVGEVSQNVEFGGISATGSTDWCVWVTNPEGDFKDYEYSAQRGLAQGSC
jgi:type IV pilus assembly protein PilA